MKQTSLPKAQRVANILGREEGGTSSLQNWQPAWLPRREQGGCGVGRACEVEDPAHGEPTANEEQRSPFPHATKSGCEAGTRRKTNAPNKCLLRYLPGKLHTVGGTE